jgi:hypothetical protein
MTRSGGSFGVQRSALGVRRSAVQSLLEGSRPKPKGLEDPAQGFNPISAKIILRRLVFVPEAQHDSSQARSAWVCSLDIWKGGTRGDLCPEGGYMAQPRVSTLGTLKINEFALKGREADLIKLACIVAPKIRVRNCDVLQLDLPSRC